MPAEREVLPTGVLTFLLTDVEGSTAMWERDADAAALVMARHDAIIEREVGGAGGTLVRPRGEGDSRFAVFSSPAGAVSAALAIQRALDGEDWPAGQAVRVRAALHTGEAELRDGDYYGPVVNRCARIRSLAWGGQTLVSAVTAGLTDGALPDGASLTDLGEQRLKDVATPERVFALAHPDLASDFPTPVRPQPDAPEPTAPVRVMIVDDHPMWRDTLAATLPRHGRVTVVAGCADGTEAVTKAAELEPDVVVMDLHLPSMGGVEATRAITAASPAVKVIVLSASDDVPDVLAAVRAGASGYLLKSASARELSDAIERVARGEVVFTPSLSGVVLGELRGEATHAVDDADLLRLVGRGLTYAQIADELAIDAAEVDARLTTILQRLKG